MFVQKDFLNKLKDFGLNSYESKLWVSLLSRGVSTAGELSDISAVPRSRAYDVLESLEKKGFIIVKVGKPIKYLAVPPAEVVERVKKKVGEEAELRNQVLSELKDSDILSELTALHSNGIKFIDPTDHSGAFRGRDKGYEHLIGLVKNAKTSITLMTTKEGLERKYELLANHLRKAGKNGVKITLIIPTSVGKETVALLEKIAVVKQLKNCEARFCLIDDESLFMFLTDDQKVHKSYDCSVWVEAPLFVEYFSKLVESQTKSC
ncbi:MAG TPA: helix-turn-helix domain-containing protein [Candidatus Nanoarchaeia archaeon]|nr:helix-turn-helix domain-containing protein [Candidatus Nanoarchaeia archaeon]